VAVASVVSQCYVVRGTVMVDVSVGGAAVPDELDGRSEQEVVASAMLDAAPDGMMMIDEHGRILGVNRQVEVLFGYARAEVVGQAVELLLPETLRQSHRAQRSRFVAEPRTRSMGAGQRLLGRRVDGAMFPVEISLSPLRAGSQLRVIAAVRDISERVVAESEAAAVRRVLDATSDAVLMFDRDTLRFTYVNDGAIAQLGYSRDELLLMTPLHIKPSFSELEFRHLIDDLTPGQSHSYTTVHRRKDGSDIPVEAVLQHPGAVLVDGSGWMVSIARDLTRRLEIEQRAQVAEREVAVLEDRQRIARDLHDRVIQRLFAAGLGIEAFRGRIRDPVVSEKLAHVVGELDNTIRELRSSIFELNLASSAQSLRSMVFDVCADERAALGFDPVVRFDGPVDSVGEDVGGHLLAVLREALSNVARHAHAGGVAVSVAVGENLVLQVEDHGVGLSDEARHQGGNGLANMVVRAEKLGGSCNVVTGRPSGATLVWRVPLP
jgi:two-component system sensor histidine kinase DevS